MSEVSEVSGVAGRAGAGGTVTARPVPIGSARYHELVSFAYDECARIDSLDYEGWLELFSEDLVYSVPCRLTRLPKDGDGFDDGMAYFAESHASLLTRIRRLQTDQAWAEQPSSRARHFLTNIVVAELETGVYQVRANLLLTRTRDDLPYDLFTGERIDEVVTTPDGFRIRRRTMLLDQTVLHSYNLSIFF